MIELWKAIYCEVRYTKRVRSMKTSTRTEYFENWLWGTIEPSTGVLMPSLS